VSHTVAMTEADKDADHLRASSALAFARALFHEAEADGLFEQGFAFASAVSVYYSIFPWQTDGSDEYAKAIARLASPVS
jgi:hypothetical protein